MAPATSGSSASKPAPCRDNKTGRLACWWLQLAFLAGGLSMAYEIVPLGCLNVILWGL